ncbi:zinc-binding dehydrogenase, partial [Salmonella enterica]
TTAWDALERSGVGKGTRLLVIGANGAVGSAALALAKIRGAQVLAAVRKADQVEALQAQGFDAIALGQPDALGGQVNAVFKGGADVIFDTTGFWLPAAVAGLAPFGRIA